MTRARLERKEKRFPIAQRFGLAAMLPFLAATGCATTMSTTTGGPPPAAVFTPSEGELPFSPVVRAGPMLYLSGQIGTTSMTPPTLVSGGIEAETRQTLENIKAVLAKS